MSDFVQLVKRDPIDLAAVAAYLDGARPEQRLAAVRTLGLRAQRRLFEAAGASPPLTLEHFVPRNVPPLVEVVHEGRNTLPAFADFRKVFCRPDDDGDVLWGYNRGGALIETTVGPGYFVVHRRADDELVIDYGRLPPRRIVGWPPILANSARLGIVVYNGMVDVMRPISQHVSIGQAYNRGIKIPQLFALCRVDIEV